MFTAVSNLRNREFVMRQDGDFFSATDPFRGWEFIQSSNVSDIFFQEFRYKINYLVVFIALQSKWIDIIG